MNKKIAILLTGFFLTSTLLVKPQKKNEIVVTGTVYISSSISPGVMNGNVIKEPQQTFRNQTIYLKTDSTTFNTKTDSLGKFSISLKPGTYIVEQQMEGTKKKTSMTQLGQFVLNVKKGDGPYKILFENSSSRRSAMGVGMPGSGTPGGKATKTTKIE